MDGKQFEDAFTAAGGWFLLTQYAEIADWTGETGDLVDCMYAKGFDADRSGSNTRVRAVLRILREGRGREALEKVRDSARINRTHPEAQGLAEALLAIRFEA